jgi:peptidoglycan/LPS O-acetylase OafA/YrhL
MRPRPWTLLLAVAAQALEAAGLLAAAVVSTRDTISGHSYQQSSGIALTFLAYLAVVAVALVGRGLFGVRQWSRTPSLLIQLFVGTTGVYLLEGHHPALGWPTLAVAVVGFAGLCLPASWQALSRPGLAEREEPAPPKPVPPAAKKKASARRR